MNINRKRKNRKLYFIIIWVISLFIIIKYKTDSKSKILSPLPDAIETIARSPILNLTKSKKSPEELKNTIHNYIGDKWNNYSVLVKDLNGDFKMEIDESTIYMAASINKIPILAALYSLHNSGEVDLDKKITLQAKDIQDYGTGSIRYDEPGSVYSIKTLAKLMIEQSDNTAAYIIANYIIGLDKNQKLVNSWGLEQTDMYKNKTSNKDMANLMQKLYQEKISNTADTQEMLSFLSNTIYNSRLPAQLPENVTVYHKIGTEVDHVHDVGIMKFDKQAYYVGIMTGDAKEGEETDKLISEIAKIIYEYLK